MEFEWFSLTGVYGYHCERSWVIDARHGLHSKIPRCCIRFFMGNWTKWWKTNDRVQIEFYHNLRQSMEIEMGFEYNHIPCLECLDAGRKPIKVHMCRTSDCGPRESSSWGPKTIFLDPRIPAKAQLKTAEFLIKRYGGQLA